MKKRENEPEEARRETGFVLTLHLKIVEGKTFQSPDDDDC